MLDIVIIILIKLTCSYYDNMVVAINAIIISHPPSFSVIYLLLSLQSNFIGGF